jgi:hypothetical protein
VPDKKHYGRTAGPIENEIVSVNTNKRRSDEWTDK